jgi:hypothetical protein
MTDLSEANLFRKAVRCWTQLADAMNAGGLDPPAAESQARRAVQFAAFLRLAGTEDVRGLPPALVRSSGDPAERDDLTLWMGLGGAVRAELLSALTSVLQPGQPAEILGRLHERLLGRSLVRDPAGRWKAISSRGARRSAGVFYTPPEVAAYIVRHCLPPSGREISVLDPASGCGVFLLAACRLAGEAACLHGVDQDPQAVLIARRALWLERATQDRAAGDCAWLERIRVGDAISDPQLDAARGQFDVVVGNPPYRRELGAAGLLGQLAQTELGRRCRTARMDLWYYFLHRGLELLRPGGRLGYIVGSYWTAASGAAKLIAEIRRSAHLEEIVCLPPSSVFPQVGGRQLILSLVKEPPTQPTRIRRPAGDDCGWEGLLAGRGESYTKTPEQLFCAGKIDLEPASDALRAALDPWPPLGQLGQVRQGIAENPACVSAAVAARDPALHAGEGVFVLRPDEVERLGLSDEERSVLRPYHVLSDLGRYRIADPPSRWLIYSTPHTWPEAEQFPRLLDHLRRFRFLLEARRETRLGLRAWWHLHWPREESLWQSPKLIAVQMGPRPAFVPAAAPVYVPFSANVFLPAAETREHLFYWAGLLNSRLLWRWFEHHAKHRGVGLEINGHVLAAAPVRRIDWALAEDREAHDRLVGLVGQRMEMERCGRSPCEIEPLDAQIDGLVDRLHGVARG